MRHSAGPGGGGRLVGRRRLPPKDGRCLPAQASLQQHPLTPQTKVSVNFVTTCEEHGDGDWDAAPLLDPTSDGDGD